MDSNVIVSERNRPFWQLPIAALCFTTAFTIIVSFIIQFFYRTETISFFAANIIWSFYIIPIGIGFSSQRKVYIDLKKSKFKPTIEIGPIQIGKWKTINSYDYVSVFHQALKNGSYTFEVNLWYDTNKHFQLYQKDDYKGAFIIGYQVSEKLDVDLLDATVANEYKWIDKNEWKQKMNESAK